MPTIDRCSVTRSRRIVVPVRLQQSARHGVANGLDLASSEMRGGAPTMMGYWRNPTAEVLDGKVVTEQVVAIVALRSDAIGVRASGEARTRGGASANANGKG